MGGSFLDCAVQKRAQGGAYTPAPARRSRQNRNPLPQVMQNCRPQIDRYFNDINILK
jgi:hypothetical protein